MSCPFEVVQSLKVFGLREQIETEHFCYDKLRCFPFVCHRQSHLQKVILYGWRTTGNVDDVIESTASPQGHHYVFGYACPWRVQNAHNPLASEFLGYLLDGILDFPEHDLIFLVILLGVRYGFSTTLHSNNLDALHFVLDTYPDCADATA